MLHINISGDRKTLIEELQTMIDILECGDSGTETMIYPNSFRDNAELLKLTTEVYDEGNLLYEVYNV